MQFIIALFSIFFVIASFTVSMADDTAVDKHITDLKSSDAQVRAKAAFELGCG